ncbi:MAG: inorganic phosphate transporter, partial [Bacteroidota bacterium]
KGAKGSSFLTAEMVNLFNENTWLILLFSLIGSTVIFQILYWLFKINILKIIVMAGTFSLAMAFAGNDLVNFIGVPLAGLESFQFFQASGSTDPGGFTMEMLRNPVKTPTLYLLIAGIVMVVTLFLNKKARTVTKTEINLGRQEEGDESFQSSFIARGIVAIALQVNRAFTFIMPKAVLRAVDTRFELVHKSKKSKEKPAFDLVRASVILIVASILITIGTNLKLPLSTTYITFMVAMGASLADRAWGRESAVYRVTGVITVVGGWFFTALIAFTVAVIMATIIYYGGLIAILALIGLALFVVYRTHVFHKKKQKEEETITAEDLLEDHVDSFSIFKRSQNQMDIFSSQMTDFYERAVNGLVNEKRKQLNKLGKEIKEFQKEGKAQRKKFDKTIKKLDDKAIHSGIFLLQVLGQMKEAQGYMRQIQALCFEYVDNHHPPFLQEEKKAYKELASAVHGYFDEVRKVVKDRKGIDTTLLEQRGEAVYQMIDSLKVSVVQKLKKAEISSRKSMAVLDLMTLTTNLLDHASSMVRIQRKFNRKIIPKS